MSAGSTPTDLLGRARAFLKGEVDEADRAELARLVDAAAMGDTHAWKELAERFQGAPGFGTAGIRGVLGAGESRMNRGLVLRVTHGLVTFLLDSIPSVSERGVVLARDGRRQSDVFQKDAASVIAAAGVPVHWIEGPKPTPLLAFAVKHLSAAAGVMITASHNPPEYNGYKVYWENAAQIVPPIDAGIADAIGRAPAPRDVARAPDSELVRNLDGIEEAYLAAIAKLGFGDVLEETGLRVAYSALHGCGQHLFLAALNQRGLDSVFPVREQAEPDGGFPTVRFPNPEEPGALDRSLALAREKECDIVLVNDPDADRLGVAVRDDDGAYAVLNGNEIGALLGDYVLSRTAEPRPLVVSTIVSSRLLSKLAAARGARYADTLTGFKWIANEALRLEAEEDVVFVFGFEEALGYTVGTAVRDKDGIGTGLVFAEMAAALKRQGRSSLDALRELWARHGLHASRQRSFGIEGSEDALHRLRSKPRFELGAERVAGIWDLAESSYRHSNGRVEARGRHRSDVLVFDLADGGRVAVRPSGTEPKLKLYLEVVEPFDDEAGAHDAADRRLDALEREILRLCGLG